MLFNSPLFIFIFLPITVLGFYLIGGREHHRIAVSWLVGASFFFYGWWNATYTVLLLVSILFNYAAGTLLSENRQKVILLMGVVANLGLLGYFKYANFFIDNINVLIGSDIVFDRVILPLAISFFTFQQITYLVDAYRGEAREYDFLHYCLFVTFFPQLIAGPIVHHREMLPQFARDTIYSLRAKHVAVGLTIFAIGLFKKVVLADGVAVYGTPVFAVAEANVAMNFFEAWVGALAYSLQLYFDFSGYSDMAIGLARMFGIRLPLNFNSPYKATSIIDFWRRWHITLARFLREYLYIPLGGSRKGTLRLLLSLMITMLLGGLWHGAGWTFVLWGGLHGFYLVINHSWRKLNWTKKRTKLRIFIARIITMLAVIVAWVPFRSESMNGTMNMLGTMTGARGISLPSSMIGISGPLEQWLTELGFSFKGMFNNMVIGDDPRGGVTWIIALFLIATLLPNTQQLMRRYRPAFETYKGEIFPLPYQWMEWRPTFLWASFITGIFIIALINLTQESEFLYFQF